MRLPLLSLLCLTAAACSHPNALPSSYAYHGKDYKSQPGEDMKVAAAKTTTTTMTTTAQTPPPPDEIIYYNEDANAPISLREPAYDTYQAQKNNSTPAYEAVILEPQAGDAMEEDIIPPMPSYAPSFTPAPATKAASYADIRQETARAIYGDIDLNHAPPPPMN